MAGFNVKTSDVMENGMSFHLTFTPKKYKPTNSLFKSHVALIQSVSCVDTTNEKEYIPFRGGKIQNQQPQTGAHRNIDSQKGEKCPVFGMSRSDSDMYKSYDIITSAGSTENTGGLGWIGEQNKDAFLKDKPSRSKRKEGMSFEHTFEVVAMCISQKVEVNGVILGVCTWGYSVNKEGTVMIIPRKDYARASQKWIQAAILWNNANTPANHIPLGHTTMSRSDGFYELYSTTRGRKSVRASFY